MFESKRSSVVIADDGDDKSISYTNGAHFAPHALTALLETAEKIQVAE